MLPAFRVVVTGVPFAKGWTDAETVLTALTVLFEFALCLSIARLIAEFLGN